LKYAVFRGDERIVSGSVSPGDLPAAVAAVTAAGRIDVVGHRIVHGGPDRDGPALVDGPLLDELRRLVPFAPLHLPPEIDAIEDIARRLPGVPQVACFDTAFHRRLPAVAQHLPLPRSQWDAGVRRYGFHGLSYEYISASIGAASLGRVVIAHLGSGSSMVALRDGQPVHTTMGLTPTGGLMMATRPGDLDPGVMVYLARQSHDTERIDRLVNDEAGLLGVSGSTADMRRLLAARSSGDTDAELAVDMFVRSVSMNVGALAAVLGGVDVLVFTGGIGAQAGAIRVEACAPLAHLGVLVDDDGFDAGGSVRVLVRTTDEEMVIARQAGAIVAHV
jgi:acetate kinase